MALNRRTIAAGLLVIIVGLLIDIAAGTPLSTSCTGSAFTCNLAYGAGATAFLLIILGLIIQVFALSRDVNPAGTPGGHPGTPAPPPFPFAAPPTTPAGSPFGAPATSPPPPPPPTGPVSPTVVCPRCRSTYPVGKFAYCPSCGAPLPFAP